MPYADMRGLHLTETGRLNGYEVCGEALQLCVIDENLTNIDSEKINEIQIAVRRAEKSDI